MTNSPRTLAALTELAFVVVVGYAVVAGRVDATLGVVLAAAVVGGPAVVQSVLAPPNENS